MPTVFYLIPLADALLAGIFFFAILKYVKTGLSQKIESQDFRDDMEVLLDKRLDHLISDLNVEIPMASMLLSGPFVGKLKGKAKNEIIKMTPEVYGRFANSHTLQQQSRKFIFAGAAFGFFLGLIHLGMLLWIK